MTSLMVRPRIICAVRRLSSASAPFALYVLFLSSLSVYKEEENCCLPEVLLEVVEVKVVELREGELAAVVFLDKRGLSTLLSDREVGDAAFRAFLAVLCIFDMDGMKTPSRKDAMAGEM